jgi:hypothetical protein
MTTTKREDVWEQREETVEIPNDRKEPWKPRNENVLSDEYYGDDQTTENETEWTC